MNAPTLTPATPEEIRRILEKQEAQAERQKEQIMETPEHRVFEHPDDLPSLDELRALEARWRSDLADVIHYAGEIARAGGEAIKVPYPHNQSGIHKRISTGAGRVEITLHERYGFWNPTRGAYKIHTRVVIRVAGQIWVNRATIDGEPVPDDDLVINGDWVEVVEVAYAEIQARREQERREAEAAEREALARRLRLLPDEC